MNKTPLSRRWYTLFSLFTFLIFLYFFFPPDLWDQVFSLFSADSMDQFAVFLRSYGWWAPMVSILLMVVQSIAAPLPSFLLAAANVIVFGMFWGSVISWVGGMAGATISFYLARRWGYPFVAKVTGKADVLKRVEEFSGNHGFLLILTARLLPFISFDLVSYLAGLSRIRAFSFLLATGIGQIPGTVLYVMVGHDLARLEEYQDRFVLIGFILVVLWLSGVWWRNNKGK